MTTPAPIYPGYGEPAPSFVAGGTPLTRAAIQTATAPQTTTYNANPNEVVEVDSSINNVNMFVQLPTAPANGTVVLVRTLAIGSSGTNILTILCGAGDSFTRAGGTTSTTIYYANTSLRCTYDSSTKSWLAETSLNASAIQNKNNAGNVQGVTSAQIDALLPANAQTDGTTATGYLTTPASPVWLWRQNGKWNMTAVGTNIA